MIEKSLYDIKIDQHRFQIPLGPVEGSITAVIPTCGKSKLLDQCLDSLDSLDDETKVILVANGDHKQEIAQKYEGRRNVDVLVMQGSFNWSMANNLGAEATATATAPHPLTVGIGPYNHATRRVIRAIF